MKLSNYKYRGARACVILQERHLQQFIETWKEARGKSIKLPDVKDPDYASHETLLRHVLRASRGYITWICKVLELPDPEIQPTPEADVIEAESENYLNQLLVKWRMPLVNISEEDYHKPEYKSRWETKYCIDSMLEHAVMHPLRHTFQLKELMKGYE